MKRYFLKLYQQLAVKAWPNQPLPNQVFLALPVNTIQIKRWCLTLVLMCAVFFQAATASVNSIPGNEVAEIKVALIEISGIVVDEKGVTLPGVTVKIKGKTQGTVTNENGAYKISVPDQNTILTFSYLGFAQQDIKVGKSATLNVTLKAESGSLNEVVIVGYGTQKKGNVTGAVTQIDAKALQDRPITRVSQGLQGLVGNLNITSTSAGGSPNATQSFNIRGFTGLGSSGSPLIVIDGVQGGDINAINPNDVESITVIKDAAASAVYGSSAPYGVLLIKTKQGKRGGAPSISYSNNLTFAQPVGMPQMLNSLDHAAIYNQSLKNAGASPFFGEEAIQRMKDFQAGTLTDETIASATGDDWLGWTGANANNDWYKIYFKDVSFSQTHNVSVNGGSENTNYYVGLGYNDREGMYRYGDDAYNRFNIRTNLSSDISNWLTFNFRGAFSKESNNTPNTYANKTGGNYMHQIGRKHPNLALRNPDGGFSDNSDVGLMESGGRAISIVDKPILTGEFVAKLAKGWDATVNYTYDGYYSNNTNHTRTVFTTLPSGTQAFIGGTSPNGFSRYSDKYQKSIINAFSSYETNVSKHNFKVLGGFVQELTSFSSLSGANNQLYSENVPSLGLSYGTTPSTSDNSSKLAIQGFFGRFNYSYDDKYLLEVVGRYDGTSRFLKDVRWKVYPGLSAGWNVHKENFWSENIANYVDVFRLRGSYGQLGDQPANLLGNYPFYPSLGTVSPTSSNWFFGSGREAYVNPPGLVDPSLTWITAATLDFGVDAAFLKNRLTATFDWYKREMSDFIGPAQTLPGVMGIAAPRTNSAALATKGFELTLGWRDNVGELGYGVRAILSDYKGEVTKYPNPDLLLNSWYEGEVMGNIWGFETDRYINDSDDLAAVQQFGLSGWSPGDIKYKDLNGDGKVDWGKSTLTDAGDRVIIGNTTPRYSYSFLTDATWKNLDLSMFIQGIGKRDAYINDNMFFGITGSEWQSSLFTHHLDRWTPENPDGFFPKSYIGGPNWKNTEPQTKYLINTAYLRIKNVQLGYTLPQNVLTKFKMQKVRLYMSIDNLATFTKMDDHSSLDPEITFGDGKIYPLQRNYSFGLNVTL